MPTPAFVPPPSASQPRRVHTRRERARRYAKLVQESLTSRIAMFLCSVLVTLVLIVGVVLFVLWLSFRPHRPRFYLSSFSLPGLAPGTATFNVTDRNPNRKIGIYYDSMDGSVYFMDHRISYGPVTPPAFVPPKNTTNILGALASLAAGDPVWDQISGTAAQSGQVGFRLDLNSTIRFKVKMWGDTHQHEMHVSCDLAVGSDGNLAAAYKDKKCDIYFD